MSCGDNKNSRRSEARGEKWRSSDNIQCGRKLNLGLKSVVFAREERNGDLLNGEGGGNVFKGEC